MSRITDLQKRFLSRAMFSLSCGMFLLAFTSAPAQMPFNSIWYQQTSPLAHNNPVPPIPSPLAFSPDGSLLLTTNPGPTECIPLPDSPGCRPDYQPFRLLDAWNGEAIRIIKSPTDDFQELFFTSDGQHLIGYQNYQKHRLLVWKVSDGELVRSFSISTFSYSHTHDVAFSPDGRYAAVSGDRSSLKVETILIWDTVNGTLLHTFEMSNPQGDYYEGAFIRFSLDSKYLSASTGGAVQLWTVSDPTSIQQVSPSEAEPILSNGFAPLLKKPIPEGTRILDISPDGKTLAALVPYKPDMGSMYDPKFSTQFLKSSDHQVIWEARVNGDAKNVKVVFSPDGYNYAYYLDFSFPSPLFYMNSFRIITTGVATAPNAPPRPHIKGDADGNSRLDVRDAIRVLKFIVHVETMEMTRQYTADMNGDGTLTIADAVMILQKTIGVTDAQ